MSGARRRGPLTVTHLAAAADVCRVVSPWRCRSRKFCCRGLDRMLAPPLFLVMPEEPIIRLSRAEDSGQPLPGRFMTVGKKRAAHLGRTDGFCAAVDAGPEAGPRVDRIHLRIPGGCGLGWPPG
ncbi:uncharacterized protein LOC135192886 [Pogoniulus pusillus]|uniref:uncharacterized protein LOC135192886 n=1 Tax=Pogoniulus pusillus TaxID=488313 RepID=UPI0030B94F12